MPRGIETPTIAPLPEAAIVLPPAIAAVEVSPAPGLYPTRAIVGEAFRARARAIAPQGTPELTGALRIRKALAPRWQEVPLRPLGDGEFEVEWTAQNPGDYEWCVELWIGSPNDMQHRGSSGADVLHLLRVDRTDVAQLDWAAAPRHQFDEIAAMVAGGDTPDVGVLLLAPIFPQSDEGVPGRDGSGHYSIDPTLGDTQSFGHLAMAAREDGLELALTVPVRCSADHPFRTQFPAAFAGDTDTPDFVAEGWRELWTAWERVFRFWTVQGIDIFHIPSPSDAPIAFWQSLIEQLRDDFPNIVFTAPQDTPTAWAEHLCGVGFTIAPEPVPLALNAWQETAPPEEAADEPAPLAPLTPLQPLEVVELTAPEVSATSEPETPTPGVDEIPCSSSNPALQVVVRRRSDGGEILSVENSAPEKAQSGHVHLPGDELGLAEHDRYYLRDLADGRAYRWSGTTNFLSLSPGDTAKSLRIERS